MKQRPLSQEELAQVTGGVGPVVIAAVAVGTPFVLGAIAGGADEYARKRGHR